MEIDSQISCWMSLCCTFPSSYCSLWRRAECPLRNYLLSQLPQLVPTQPGVSLGAGGVTRPPSHTHNRWPTAGRFWCFLCFWLCWCESLLPTFPDGSSLYVFHFSLLLIYVHILNQDVVGHRKIWFQLVLFFFFHGFHTTNGLFSPQM